MLISVTHIWCLYLGKARNLDSVLFVYPCLLERYGLSNVRTFYCAGCIIICGKALAYCYIFLDICLSLCTRDQSISKNLNYNFYLFLRMYHKFPQDQIMTFIHQQCDLLFHHLWYVDFYWFRLLKIVSMHMVGYHYCIMVEARSLMNMNS